MGLSDTAADTGSDKGHQHQHRHSKHHHHRHKHDHHGNGSSSSDYKHKHKHRHHRHRHHKHHGHKKHRRHKSKVDVDKAAIENALKLLEADALEAVKDQVATELNPETVELMLAAGTSESASEDSSSGSGSEEGDATATAVGETTATAVGGTTATAVGGTATAAVGEIATAAVGEIAAAAVETTSSVVQTVRITKTQPLASDSAPSDSIPSEEGTESGSALARESGTLVSSCQDGKTDSDTLHSVAVGDEPHSSSKLESESDSEDDSESDIAFGTPKLSSGPRNSKTIRIKIHRTTLPGREKEDYSLSALSSTRGPKSNDGTDTEFESSRETKTIRTGDSKITYVNLKAKSLDSEGRKADGSSKVPFGKSTASEDEELRSSSPEGRGKERERRKRSLKRSSRHHRSRSRSRSRSQSRSRSRSPRAGQHRHRSHKYHYSQSKSQSRSRSRSPHSRRRSSRYRRSRSRSRSRSGRHRCSRSRSYTRHRTKSRSRSRSRSHSRSRRRCSRRRRYSRSSSRRRSPRRRRSYYRSRSRSPYRSRRRRHSSRSRSRSRRRSRSHSRSRSRSQSRSSSRGRNREQEKPASKASVVTAISTAAAAIEATVADLTDPKKAHIAQLTAFCQELQVKQAQEEAGAEEGETEWGGAESEPQLRAPFELNPAPAYQPGLIFHNNAWKTANQIAAEMDARIDEKPVEEKFPVSSGLPHRSTTGNIPGVLNVSESIFARTQPVSVGDLVAKRLEATHRLQQNPADYEAHQTLAHIEQQTKQWAQSKIKLGQFTGEASLTAMSSKEHNIGQQAWAKKDMFFRLAPVMGGVGMKMMMKMGWRAGQPLGKKGEGHVEPISVQVKVNRSGLSTVTDKQPPIVPATSLQALDARGAHLVQGKHPVSALQEICSKKKWDPPHYEMVDVSGPAHKKTFLFRVTVPLGTFQPAVASNNKKVAKAQAALAALQGLGLASGSVEYSAS